MKTNGIRTAQASVLLLVGLLLGLGLHSATSQGVRVLPAGSEVGRYQIVPAGTGSNPFIYFLDTKTGRLWLQSSPGSEWKRANAPIDASR